MDNLSDKELTETLIKDIKDLEDKGRLNPKNIPEEVIR